MVRYGRDVLGTRANRIAGMVFVAMRRAVPKDVQERFAEEGIWEDIIQEAYVIALEIAYRTNLPENDREVLRLASRKWYAFLRASGYRRPRGAKTFIKDTFSDEYEQEELLYSSVLKI